MADPGMFSQVLGLVSQGLSPQEAKAQIEQARIIEMAKMKPEERIYAGVAGATDRFAGGLGRLLGGGQEEDAMLRKASDFAAMRNEIDPTSPESLATAAKQMYKMGFTTQGNMYAKAAQEALKQQAEIGAKKAETTLKGAQTTKAGQETQEIVDKQAAKGARVQMLKDAGLGDSEAMGIASNDSAFAKYIETKKVPVPSEYAVQAQKLGYTAKPYLSDYTPDQVKQMEKGVFAYKAGIAQAGATVNKPVDVAAIIKEIGTTQDIKGKADIWKLAGEAYKTQVPMIEKLKEVKSNLPATFTGSFSETALQFGKALSALGVPIDENKLSNTEYMNSVSSQVLQTIARNFPGSLAVKEMDQLVKSKFSSPQQIKTIARILGDLQTEIEAGTKSYEQLAKLPETERYSRDLNLLTGQNYTKLKRYRDLENKAMTAKKTGQPISKAEFDEAQKLQKELGVQ